MKSLLLLCCCLPLKHLHLNSAYGYRHHPLTGQCRLHKGIDLYARQDTVFAIMDGSATVAYNDLLGCYIRSSDEQLVCTYGHLSAFLIGAGPVTCGQPIAITGATGRVTGEHLHLSISYQGKPLDPLKFLYQLTIKSNNHE
jgi:murein DD-endopeptidase MepM/ murein hydrolase activator NlpD